MAFQPAALNERTLKQFVDRLTAVRQQQPRPTDAQWPPKRSQIQEEIATVLGFSSWHAAIHAVRPIEGKAEGATPKSQQTSETFGLYPLEEARNTFEDFNKILAWAGGQGASDITFSTGDEVVVERHGKRFKATRRQLSGVEVEDMVKALHGQGELASTIMSIDLAHHVLDEGAQQWRRFRINASPFTKGGPRGWQITCRAHPSNPPTLAELGASQYAPYLQGRQPGLVIVSGQTGSGKTTLLGAMLGEIATDKNQKILTYESPIELDCSKMQSGSSIAQHSVLHDVPSFAYGITNAMRRGASTIMVGECRDNETLLEAVQAARCGHTVLTGVQAWGVADTILRLIRSYEDKEALAVSDFIQSLSLVVAQILVPSTDGKQIALRESLVFNEEVVDRLLDVGRDDIRAEIGKLLNAHNQGFAVDAREKHAQGLISEKTLKGIERSARRG